MKLDFPKTESPPDHAAHQPMLVFPNPQQISLSVRASALVFADPESQKLLALIERVAPSNATAWIKGETGTGKELVARHIHALSPRSKGPFAAINCGAFSETLVESELFGYERGAFTGATGSKKGWFESANGGTLFLDEIGDLPLATQVKLLRVLQEREVVRIGSRTPTPIDVRLIAATNVNLEEAVQAGRFREDLYYRINVVPIPLAPLRERPDDILPLTKHFISLYGNRLHAPEPELHPDTLELLYDYPWPGNIRELENTIHRALLVCDGNALLPSQLNLPTLHTDARERLETGEHAGEGALKREFRRLFERGQEEIYESVNRMLVLQAYEHARNNQVRAAKLLGISRNVLRTQLKQYGVID
ncbi:MAG: sigma 54-interacting transcriptional regulator [Gallionellaceae bacterium]|jgi:sigma-54-specific transcriptional regulator|nr:sigma 54-interacting transcriptional regulator [Gallionellaceae bacterium]